jgi:hypothetical protein
MWHGGIQCGAGWRRLSGKVTDLSAQFFGISERIGLVLDFGEPRPGSFLKFQSKKQQYPLCGQNVWSPHEVTHLAFPLPAPLPSVFLNNLLFLVS